MAWDWLKQLVRRDGSEMFLEWIDAAPPPDNQGGHTVQVRLVDMHLGRSRDWGRDRVPVLQTSITAPSGVVVPMTISPKGFETLGNDRWQWAEQRDIPLTGQLAFNVRAGELRLLVGLLYVTGSGVLTQASAFLGSLSQLVHAPQLSAAAGIATKIADGAESLIGVADPAGRVVFETSIPWDGLRRGHLLAAGVDEHSIDRSALAVHDGRLIVDGQPARNLRSLDYVLLRVDVLADSGESWEQIPTIKEPFDRAIAALGDPALAEEAKAQLLAAMRAAMACSDLTVAERARVRDLVRARWEETRDSFGVLAGRTPGDVASLSDLIAAG